MSTPKLGVLGGGFAGLEAAFLAREPFHAGAGWQMMDVGLKGMTRLLAA